MNHWRVCLSCFVLTALVAWVGCGGGSTYIPDPGPGGGDQLPVGTWEGTAALSAIDDPGIEGLPDIPYDGMSASRVTSEETTQLELLGSQYLQKYNAEVVGTTLVLNAPTTAPVGGFGMAFGLYKFSGLNAYDLQWLNIECLPAQFGMEYYVAVADYTLGDWRWFGPVTFPEFQLDLRDLQHHLVTELGNMYFVVVCEAGNSATISKSTLTVAAGGDEQLLPCAPHHLIATDGVYDDKVVLEWEPGLGADHYEIWRKTSEDGVWDDLAIEDSNRYEDLAVEPGHVYWYKARSVNDSGSSGWSNVDEGYAGEPDGETPPAPWELHASDGTHADKVVVEWHYAIDGAAFDIYRKVHESEGEWAVIGETTEHHYYDWEVEPDVVYVYKAVAWVGGVHSEPSNTDTGYAGSGGGGDNPPAPWDLTASDGTHEEKVVVEWNYEIEGAGFDIYRKLYEHEGAEWEVIGETLEHHYYDWEVDAEVVYSYKAVAWVEGEQSEPSNTDTGYAGGGGGGLNAPFELWASDGNYENKVRLEWGHEGDYGYFEVWRIRDGEGYEWHKIGQTETKDYNDEEVDAEVVYIYKVRAILGDLESDWSNHDSGYASGGGGGEVTAPWELWATDGAHSEKVVVSWSHEGDFDYFDIWRKRDGEGYEWGRIGTTEEYHYLDWEVDPGVVYIYKARVILNEQESEWSNTDSGYAGEGENPPAPWELWATDGAHPDKVVVIWGYEIEGAWFDVYRRVNEEGSEWGVLDETQDHAYHDYDVDGDTVYVYKVVAWVEGNNSEPSNADTGYASGGGGVEPPWNLVASDGTHEGMVVVTWDYEGDAFFDVWRKRDGEGYEWGVIGETSDQAYHDEAVDAGVHYIYKVRAWVEGVSSGDSNTDVGWAAEGGGIPAPFELWASDGTHPGYVRIEWAYEGDYSYFDLWRKRDGEGYEWCHLANSETLGWSDDDLDIGVVYIYKVRAILGEQESEFSNTDSGWAAAGD